MKVSTGLNTRATFEGGPRNIAYRSYLSEYRMSWQPPRRLRLVLVIFMSVCVTDDLRLRLREGICRG
jgi:hypothetical protein